LGIEQTFSAYFASLFAFKAHDSHGGVMVDPCHYKIIPVMLLV